MATLDKEPIEEVVDEDDDSTEKALELNKPKEYVRTCDHCDEKFDVGQHILERDFQEVPGYGMIAEVGIMCPHCDFFYFAGFMSNALRKRRQVLNDQMERARGVGDAGAKYIYIKNKMRYQRAFDRFNVQMGKRFKRKLPEAPGQWKKKLQSQLIKKGSLS